MREAVRRRTFSDVRTIRIDNERCGAVSEGSETTPSVAGCAHGLSPTGRPVAFEGTKNGFHAIC
jgi:hypothetical protein